MQANIYITRELPYTLLIKRKLPFETILATSKSGAQISMSAASLKAKERYEAVINDPRRNDSSCKPTVTHTTR
jgi:hypothetical protein